MCPTPSDRLREVRTLTTAPCILPNSADAPTDWTCTS
jgi:hypothetical protein